MQLFHSTKLIVHFRDMSWARLQAMLSSLETEMPTATGVFEPERAQPFMPPNIEEKLVENSKVYFLVQLLLHQKCFQHSFIYAYMNQKLWVSLITTTQSNVLGSLAGYLFGCATIWKLTFSPSTLPSLKTQKNRSGS